MVPRLDLAQSSPGKVMIAPPRLNLRRTASYNDRSSALLSSTSSRFNFNHLLYSPPPSPSLPALIPRRKPSASDSIFRPRPGRVIRTLIGLVFLFFSFRLIAFAIQQQQQQHRRGILTVESSQVSDIQHDLTRQVDGRLPDFPTPVVVSGADRQLRWTVSIPRNYDFPLSIKEYSQMSGLCRDTSAKAQGLSHQTPSSTSRQILRLAHDGPDNKFVDVHEAEKSGLLPAPAHEEKPRHSGHFVGADLESSASTREPFCEQSLTYVLESANAGLGETVMALWTLYSLATEQGRSFFVDDSHWAFGSYTDLFPPPSAPNCRPPPRHHMLPCPVQCRHLVVSSVTLRDVMPALLAQQHQSKAPSRPDSRRVFELAHRGFKTLFRLSHEDQDYVTKRVSDIRARAQQHAKLLPVDLPIVGLHIRRGDRHPYEFQYRESYIPTDVFADRGKKLVEAYYNKTSVKPEHYEAVRVVASDDPMVHEEVDFSDAMPAQDRIRLATKQVIEEANPDPHYLRHPVDEAFGWEGGFFAAMFWNLGGKPGKSAAAEGDRTRSVSVSDDMLRLRSLVGRAYMMDLAVLAGASDKIVCAVSAMGCRLLAVMMGWERAMVNGDWENVDGEYSWVGLTW